MYLQQLVWVLAEASRLLCRAVWSGLQGKQILQDGIGRATEIEEPLDPVAARQFLQQPSQLLQLPSQLMQNLARWGSNAGCCVLTAWCGAC